MTCCHCAVMQHQKGLLCAAPHDVALLLEGVFEVSTIGPWASLLLHGLPGQQHVQNNWPCSLYITVFVVLV